MQYFILAMTFLFSSYASASNNLKYDPVVATVGDVKITLSEIDVRGLNKTIPQAEELYRTRSQYLYILLTEELLKKEAAKEGLTVNKLLDREVTDKKAEIGSEQVQEYILNNPNVKDIKDYQKKVPIYLKVEAHKKQKRAYINTLLKKAKVKISLYRPPELPALKVAGEMEHITGPNDAPVEIILFSDFECPYCQQLHGTLSKIGRLYPKSVVIKHKNFPIPGHELGAKAALGSYCAGKQGKFKEYYDSIFTTSGRLSNERIDMLPIQLSLDDSDFKSCLADPSSAIAVENDKIDGKAIGVQATPTMVINGKVYPGAKSLDALETIIDALVAKK